MRKRGNISMGIKVIKLEDRYLEDAVEIWNQVVLDGRAFPQIETLKPEEAAEFFAAQTYTAVAVDDSGEAVGLYTLHPNNIGRCGHLANASYAVKRDKRGMHVGESLVRDCIDKAREAGFGVLQFNAVVASNTPALNLYKKLGFIRLGTIPKGFKNIDGVYEDIILHYMTL